MRQRVGETGREKERHASYLKVKGERTLFSGTCGIFIKTDHTTKTKQKVSTVFK